MRYAKLFVALLIGLGGFMLGGCASKPVAALAPASIWQDAAFDYQPQWVTETPESVFALDPELVQSLRAAVAANLPVEYRLELLLSRLYTREGVVLSYTSGHTTGALQTWRNKRGDCLSLTILAYAAAKALRIDAHMQEVPVAMVVDRRDGVDYINGHVNVFVASESGVALNGQMFGSGGFVIDFEPQPGSRRVGQWLTENDILARYYNNRATEFMVALDHRKAYAYYRAAIAAQPSFAPVYANLAQLYLRQGLRGNAEALLLHALTLGGPSLAPLGAMHQLLASQGRWAEAQHYADLLKRRQDEDPYYWFGQGMTALNEGRFDAAIRALERAATKATGFEEIHYNLGLAFLRNGQPDAAGKQLAMLAAINQRAPGVAVLSKKMQSLAPS